MNMLDKAIGFFNPDSLTINDFLSLVFSVDLLVMIRAFGAAKFAISRKNRTILILTFTWSGSSVG